MEFTIDRSCFLEKLALVSRAISAHSPMPIMSGVLIQVRPDRIVLTGSSNDFIIQTEIFPDEKNLLEIQDPGSMAVDARVLNELLRRMSGALIRIITMDDSLMRLSGPDGNFDLVGFPGEDYPAVMLDRPQLETELPAELLRQIAEQVGYAASEKDSRQVLMGINLQMSDGILAAAATDSYRLARKVAPVDSTESFSITVPVNTFNEVVRSFGNEKMIKIYLNKKKIQFSFDHTLIQSQLYEGSYPDASRIIPGRFISTLRVDARDIEGTLDRSSIYTSSTSSSGSIVPVRMECEPESVSLQVLTSEIGTCRQKLESALYEGDPLAVSFNAKLVSDALRGLRSKGKVEFGFTGELRPIRIINPEDPTLTMIVVPIRSS